MEFAVMLPFVMLLLLGIIEIGRFAYFSILVANAAHAGAMYGAHTQTDQDATGMEAAAQADMGSDPVGTAAPSPTPQFGYQCVDTTTGAVDTAFPAATPCTSGTPVAYVQVTMTGTIKPIFRYPLLPSSFTVTKSSLMRVIDQ